MDYTPALPPWGNLTKEETACIARAAYKYEVPEILLHAVIAKERGTTGKCSTNKNGTVDCGVAQINNSWSDYFKKYGVDYDQIKNNPCTNIQASAYILKKNYLIKEGNWYNAIVSYNIGPAKWTPNRLKIGRTYANDVVKIWTRMKQYSEEYSSQIKNLYQNKDN